MLSIIVLNYNTLDLTRACIDSLLAVKGEVPFEIVVVDNASTDGSVEYLKKLEKNPLIKVIFNPENVGFARGNNVARKVVKGEYVLFLNSDTVVPAGTLQSTLAYMKAHSKVGALTCKLLLPDGTLDKDARRSFPTPWVALTHFSRLDRVFPKSPLFARYWYGYMDPDAESKVDVIQGAFFLTRKELLDAVNWFDEDYFLDGEDIDLSWKITQAGYTIMYYPAVSITHVKGASKGKRKQKASFKTRSRAITTGVTSMHIFYKKHLSSKYPWIVNALVAVGIRSLLIARTVKLYLGL